MRLAVPLLSAACLAAAAAGDAAAQAIGARIDSVFAAWDSAGAPGCVAGVRRGGETVHEKAYGMADLAHGVPLSPGSVLDVGSVSKQVTAAAVLLLVQEGKLSLDDDVRKHLPELPDFGAVITLRHLLSHTSGLRDHESLLILRDRFPGMAVHTFGEVMHLLSRQRSLNFAPGAEHLYSNSGYVAAAVLVERVSGRSLADFTAERLFRPLGMTRTSWREDPRRVLPGLARAYRRDEEGRWLEDVPVTHVYGQGGLRTTVGDLLAWNDALATGRVPGGRWLVERMETPAALPGGARTTYGMGLMSGTHQGAREVHHDGGTAGYSSFAARYPEHDLSLAVLCNAAEAEPAAYGRRIAALFLPPPPAAAPERPPPSPAVDPARIARLAGLYLDTTRARTLRIEASDTALSIGRAVFRPTAPAAFAHPAAGRMEFAMDGERVRAMTSVNPLGVRATWIPVSPADPDSAALREYEGTYASEELGVGYVVRRHEGRLEIGFDPGRARLPFAFVFDRPEPLTPIYPDGFDAGGFKLRFVRDAAGRVSGLRVYMERARNVGFSRVR